MQQIIVEKGRTKVIPVSIGYDVSNDVITSQIRVDKDPESELIAEWDVSYLTDGVDGEVILKLDDSVSAEITQTVGYMDLKRFSGGEPLSVFEGVLEVLFKPIVTV